MPAFTIEYTLGLEDTMRLVSTGSYNRVASDLWYPHITKRLPSTSRKELLSWFIETAQITRLERGESRFENLAMHQYEVEAQPAGSGFKLSKEDFEDQDSNGINSAIKWAQGIGAWFGYWPQQQIAELLLDNPVGYDDKALFATDHPLNPANPTGDTYSNLISGVRIDTSVTVDAAKSNLATVIKNIKNIKMPNGKAPRQLRVKGIMGPAALEERLIQLTSAQFIAQAAGSGGGSADVAAVIRNFGFGTPIIATELGAAYTTEAGNSGSDTTYYVFCEDIISDELGGVVWVEREPFSIVFNDGMTDTQLQQTRQLVWTTHGRNAAAPGHPYMIFKCTA